MSEQTSQLAVAVRLLGAWVALKGSRTEPERT